MSILTIHIASIPSANVIADELCKHHVVTAFGYGIGGVLAWMVRNEKLIWNYF